LEIPLGRVVWVIGSEHARASRCFSWTSSFPDFSECDVLIINIPSLSRENFPKVSGILYEWARRRIFEMLMTGEKEVIVVLSPDQNMSMWLPVYPLIESIAPTRVGEYDVEPFIEDYMENVETCEYYIRDFDMHYVYAMTNPSSMISEKYFFTAEAMEKYELRGMIGNRVENKAGQIIGCHFRFKINYGWDWLSNKPRGAFSSGRIIFLPPPTKTSPEKAIDQIVNALVSEEPAEPTPAWEAAIELPGLKNIEDSIKKREKLMEEIQREIEELQRQREAITKYRRLLWTKGQPLEEIVKEAFKMLGFEEIRRTRRRDGGWNIEFKHTSQYQIGAIDVKGSEEQISLADLVRCNRWAEDHLLEGRKAKAIMVINQHRLEDLSQSIQKRESLPQDLMEYAQRHEICILPTHEIFYAVLEKLRGGTKLNRKNIEQKLANTTGICKLASIAEASVA